MKGVKILPNSWTRKLKTTDKILEKLKHTGSVTAKQLSNDFNMTSMGARQHLQALEEAGLVEHYDVKVQVGRPTRHWKLTGQGHDQFVDGHGDLTVQFIEAVEHVFGQNGMAQIAYEREKQTLKRYQTTLNKQASTIEEKLKVLARLRDEDG